MLFACSGNNGVLALDSFLPESGMTIVQASLRTVFRMPWKNTWRHRFFSRTDLLSALGDAERAIRQPH